MKVNSKKQNVIQNKNKAKSFSRCLKSLSLLEEDGGNSKNENNSLQDVTEYKEEIHIKQTGDAMKFQICKIMQKRQHECSISDLAKLKDERIPIVLLKRLSVKCIKKDCDGSKRKISEIPVKTNNKRYKESRKSESLRLEIIEPQEKVIEIQSEISNDQQKIIQKEGKTTKVKKLPRDFKDGLEEQVTKTQSIISNGQQKIFQKEGKTIVANKLPGDSKDEHEEKVIGVQSTISNDQPKIALKEGKTTIVKKLNRDSKELKEKENKDSLENPNAEKVQNVVPTKVKKNIQNRNEDTVSNSLLKPKKEVEEEVTETVKAMLLVPKLMENKASVSTKFPTNLDPKIFKRRLLIKLEPLLLKQSDISLDETNANDSCKHLPLPGSDKNSVEKDIEIKGCTSLFTNLPKSDDIFTSKVDLPLTQLSTEGKVIETKKLQTKIRRKRILMVSEKPKPSSLRAAKKKKYTLNKFNKVSKASKRKRLRDQLSIRITNTPSPKQKSLQLSEQPKRRGRPPKPLQRVKTISKTNTELWKSTPDNLSIGVTNVKESSIQSSVSIKSLSFSVRPSNTDVSFEQSQPKKSLRDYRKESLRDYSIKTVRRSLKQSSALEKKSSKNLPNHLCSNLQKEICSESDHKKDSLLCSDSISQDISKCMEDRLTRVIIYEDQVETDRRVARSNGITFDNPIDCELTNDIFEETGNILSENTEPPTFQKLDAASSTDSTKTLPNYMGQNRSKRKLQELTKKCQAKRIDDDASFSDYPSRLSETNDQTVPDSQLRFNSCDYLKVPAYNDILYKPKPSFLELNAAVDCKSCSLRFTTNRQLRWHLKFDHPRLQNELQQMDTKPTQTSIPQTLSHHDDENEENLEAVAPSQINYSEDIVINQELPKTDREVLNASPTVSNSKNNFSDSKHIETMITPQQLEQPKNCDIFIKSELLAKEESIAQSESSTTMIESITPSKIEDDGSHQIGFSVDSSSQILNPSVVIKNNQTLTASPVFNGFKKIKSQNTSSNFASAKSTRRYASKKFSLPQTPTQNSKKSSIEALKAFRKRKHVNNIVSTTAEIPKKNLQTGSEFSPSSIPEFSPVRLIESSNNEEEITSTDSILLHTPNILDENRSSINCRPRKQPKSNNSKPRIFLDDYLKSPMQFEDDLMDANNESAVPLPDQNSKYSLSTTLNNNHVIINASEKSQTIQQQPVVAFNQSNTQSQPTPQQFCILFIPDAIYNSDQQTIDTSSQSAATFVNFQPMADSERPKKQLVFTPTPEQENQIGIQEVTTRSHVCNNCTELLELMSTLEARSSLSDENKIDTVCPYCSKMFQSLVYLQYHVMQEHLKCTNENLCRNSSITLSLPAEPQQPDHEIYFSFSLKCRNCYTIFCSVREVNEHVMLQHKILVRFRPPMPFLSPGVQLGENGLNKSLLVQCSPDCVCRVGMRTTTSPLQRQQMIKRCPNAMRRLEKVDSAAYEIFNCQICKGTYVVKDDVIDHLTKNHKVTCKHLCKICLHSFRTNELLDSHCCSGDTLPDKENLLNIAIIPVDLRKVVKEQSQKQIQEHNPLNRSTVPNGLTRYNGVKSPVMDLMQKKPRIVKTINGKHRKRACPKCKKKMAYKKSLRDHVTDHLVHIEANPRLLALELLNLHIEDLTNLPRFQELQELLKGFCDPDGMALVDLVAIEEEDLTFEETIELEKEEAREAKAMAAVAFEQEEIMECTKCFATYKCFVPLDDSLRRSLRHREPLCNSCTPKTRGRKPASSKKQYIADSTTNEPNANSACEKCERCFSSNRMLEKHYKCRHNDNAKSELAAAIESICEADHISDAGEDDFSSAEAIAAMVYDVTHALESTASAEPSGNPVSKEPEQLLECSFCEELCSSNVSLKNHLKREHGRKASICQFCNGLLVDTSEVRHMLDNHIKCNGRPLLSSLSLCSSSSEEVTAEDVEELVRTLGKHQLKSLMMYHEFEGKCNNAVMRCPICPEQFATRESCRFHYIWNHDTTCLLCDEVFRTGSVACQHKKDEHTGTSSYLWCTQRLCTAIVQGFRLDPSQPPHSLYASLVAKLDGVGEMQDTPELDITLPRVATDKPGTAETLDEVVLSEDQLPDSSNMVEVVIGKDDAEDDLLCMLSLSPNYESCRSEQSKIPIAGSAPPLEDDEESHVSSPPPTPTPTIQVPSSHLVDNYVQSGVCRCKLDNGEEQLVLVVTDEDLITYKDNMSSLAEQISKSCDSFSREEISEMLKTYCENASTNT